MPGKHRFLFVVAVFFFFSFSTNPKEQKKVEAKRFYFLPYIPISHSESNPEGATQRYSPELSHGIFKGKAKLQKPYSGDRFGEITLVRHGVFSFYYLKMIGKRGKRCVQPLGVFLIFCIFRSQGETEAGDNKFANGSVLNVSVNGF